MPRPTIMRLREEIERENKSSSVVVVGAGDCLRLENLVCVDAEGKEFERYDTLYVAKDVVRNGTTHRSFTPYQAITHFEQEGKGFFVPSFSLSCNILAALYAHKDIPEAHAVLQQYRYHRAGSGWQAQ